MSEEDKKIVSEGWFHLSEEITLIELTIEDKSNNQYTINQAIKHYQLAYNLFFFFFFNP